MVLFFGRRMLWCPLFFKTGLFLVRLRHFHYLLSECGREEKKNRLTREQLVPRKVSSGGYGYVIGKGLAPGRMLGIWGITGEQLIIEVDLVRIRWNSQRSTN